MLSYLGSYIWGSEDDEQVGIVVVEGELACSNNTIEVDNEWLLVPPKDDEGNTSTELALVGDGLESLGEVFEVGEECAEEHGEMGKQDGKGVNGKRTTVVRFIPLKDLNDRVLSTRKSSSPKNLKRNNLVQVRLNNARKSKQFGRMDGKHVGMVASRCGRN